MKYVLIFSAGGLVTAVAPVVIDCQGLWVGWTGLDDFNPKIERIPESEVDDKAPTAGLLSKQAVPVAVDRGLFDRYYNGCCNETFWPLFHSMPDRAIFHSGTWAVSIISGTSLYTLLFFSVIGPAGQDLDSTSSAPSSAFGSS